jgi:hypothetical protein
VTVPQITIRVSPSTKLSFQRYARRLGLDITGLAQLLILREKRLRRLQHAANAKAATRPRRSSRRVAVTAHVPNVTNVHEFRAYAKGCGLSSSDAGAWLVSKELEEHWLERSLGGGRKRNG